MYLVHVTIGFKAQALTRLQHLNIEEVLVLVMMAVLL
jgi:hypothetical protein